MYQISVLVVWLFARGGLKPLAPVWGHGALIAVAEVGQQVLLEG